MLIDIIIIIIIIISTNRIHLLKLWGIHDGGLRRRDGFGEMIPHLSVFLAYGAPVEATMHHAWITRWILQKNLIPL